MRSFFTSVNLVITLVGAAVCTLIVLSMVSIALNTEKNKKPENVKCWSRMGMIVIGIAPNGGTEDLIPTGKIEGCRCTIEVNGKLYLPVHPLPISECKVTNEINWPVF